MSTVEAISPKDIALFKQLQYPNEVIEAFNELIAENYVNGESVILQKDVISRILLKKNCSAANVFDNNWLNVEELYTSKGWDVEYDKPAYNETYFARFVFTRRIEK